MTLPDYDPENLSYNPTTASLEMLLGPELYEKLSSEMGGRRLAIPKKSGENTLLSVLLGLDAAQRLSEIYGGLLFDVPLRAGRRARVLRRWREGMPIARIPHAENCSYYYVWSVIRAERAAQEKKDQMDLFSPSK